LRGPSIAYVKKTFLNENLDEEVYLAIPKRTSTTQTLILFSNSISLFIDYVNY